MQLVTLSHKNPAPTEPVTSFRMLSPKDIAGIFGISYESALAFIKYSGIDYILVGRQYRVSEEKLKRFISKEGSIAIDLGSAEKLAY